MHRRSGVLDDMYKHFLPTFEQWQKLEAQRYFCIIYTNDFSCETRLIEFASTGRLSFEIANKEVKEWVEDDFKKIVDMVN